MIDGLKGNWADFKRSQPGRRFQDRYERRQQSSHGRWDKQTILNILLGIAIVAAGVLLVPAPGPGALVGVLGLALLGSEFAPVARALDRGELKFRAVGGWAKDLWNRAPIVGKALLVGAGVACATAIAYGAYWLLTGG